MLTIPVTSTSVESGSSKLKIILEGPYHNLNLPFVLTLSVEQEMSDSLDNFNELTDIFATIKAKKNSFITYYFVYFNFCTFLYFIRLNCL